MCAGPGIVQRASDSCLNQTQGKFASGFDIYEVLGDERNRYKENNKRIHCYTGKFVFSFDSSKDKLTAIRVWCSLLLVNKS